MFFGKTSIFNKKLLTSPFSDMPSTSSSDLHRIRDTHDTSRIFQTSSTTSSTTGTNPSPSSSSHPPAAESSSSRFGSPTSSKSAEASKSKIDEPGVEMHDVVRAPRSHASTISKSGGFFSFVDSGGDLDAQGLDLHQADQASREFQAEINRKTDQLNRDLKSKADFARTGNNVGISLRRLTEAYSVTDVNDPDRIALARSKAAQDNKKDITRLAQMKIVESGKEIGRSPSMMSLAQDSVIVKLEDINPRNRRSQASAKTGAAQTVRYQVSLADGDVKVKPLYHLPEISSIIHCNRPVYRSWGLSFLQHPDLEVMYAEQYKQNNRFKNQMWVFLFTVMFLLISVYDYNVSPDYGFSVMCTGADCVPSDAAARMAIAMRIAGGLVGFLLVICRQCWSMCEVQALSGLVITLQLVLWTTMTAFVFMHITSVSTVAFIIIFLTVVFHFVGLRYSHAIYVSISFALYWAILIVYLDYRIGDEVVFNPNKRPAQSGKLVIIVIAILFNFLSARHNEFQSRVSFLQRLQKANTQANTDELLRSMLPAPIMKEITLDKGVVVHEVSQATVMFCDIVQFTRLANEMCQGELVAVLNVMFSTFDDLTTKYSVYKVETIGDAYLACSGVIHQKGKYTNAMVDCALEFQTRTKHFVTLDKVQIKTRIGIHTGDVIAGVVGRKMPRYHLFGQTITITEAVESGGVAQSVSISETTYQALDNKKIYKFDNSNLEPLLLEGGETLPRYLISFKETPTQRLRGSMLMRANTPSKEHTTTWPGSDKASVEFAPYMDRPVSLSVSTHDGDDEDAVTLGSHGDVGEASEVTGGIQKET